MDAHEHRLVGGRQVAALVAALVVILLLAGCGAKQSPDSFVGTWGWSAHSPALIVSKHSRGYLVALVDAHRTRDVFSFVRRGSELRGVLSVDGGKPPKGVTIHMASPTTPLPGGSVSVRTAATPSSCA